MDVAIIGIGLHRFGRSPGLSGMQQGASAVRNALADAGLSWKDMQFAYGGSQDAGNADALVNELGLTGLQFTNIWNDFLFGASFADFDSTPITVALKNLVNSSTGVKEYNVHFAGAILAALPTLVVYIVSGRYFVRGLMAGAVKG